MGRGHALGLRSLGPAGPAKREPNVLRLHKLRAGWGWPEPAEGGVGTEASWGQGTAGLGAEAPDLSARKL